MKIIISPAKKMRENIDGFGYKSLPEFLGDTEIIAAKLKLMSYDELKVLWKCNDSIAELNMQRLDTMDLYNRLTPAIIAYEGIQYQYMAPEVFTESELAYIEENLRILSGFYGVLRPFDGVTPYRLEMQAKLSVGGKKNLYDFWGDKIAKNITDGTDCIINLASKEYSKCVTGYLPENVRFITCVFGEEKDGKIVEKGTMCKMARGEMVRFMAQNQIDDVEKLKSFNGLDYIYCQDRSDEKTFVFIKKKQIKTEDC